MAAHRYWRISLFTNNYGSAWGLGEIEFRTTAGVALPFSGGTASASTTYSGSYLPSYSTDGNPSTFWASLAEATSWWAYDFGAGNSRDVVEILLTARPDSFYNQAPNTFAPEWSDDGVAWTSMH